MNQLLEGRLINLRESLDILASAVDDNLRAVLLRLTCDKTISASSPLTDIDALARVTREKCLHFVAREHPLANDLKFAMAALRVGHDYERIQELAVALNKRSEKLTGSPLQDVAQDMTGIMADILKLHDIVRRTWQRDRKDSSLPNLKPEVSALTLTIYAQISTIQNKIMEAITSGNGSAETFVELVLACRHLKRIANTMELIPDELHAFDKQE